MATTVAMTPAVSTAPTGAAASSPPAARAPASGSPFQAILAASQTEQTQATVAAGATDATAPPRSANATAGTNLPALPTLLALVAQTLGLPANAAIAQATGQAEEAETPAATTPEERSRADQLSLALGNGPAGLTTTTAATTARTAAPVPAANTTAPLPGDTTPTDGTNAATGATPPPTATPAAVVALVATPAGEHTAPNVTAQAPIIPGLLPGAAVPSVPSVANPPVAGPSAPLPAPALPPAQLGDRPATTGDRLAADAAAGARLAPPPAPPVGFADALARQVNTAAVPPGAPAPTVAGTTVLPNAVQAVTPAAVRVTTADVTNAPLNVFAAPPNGGAGFQSFEWTLRQSESRRAGSESDAAAAVQAAGPQPTPVADQPAPVAAVEQPKATPAAQVADAMVEHARVLERPGSVEFQMRLDPPDLGRLQIRLVARGDEIHGQVLVANDAVRGMIESQLPELRQRLEAAGLNVQQFDVSTGSGGGGRNAYRDPALPDFAPPAPALATPRARTAPAPLGVLDVTA